MYIQKDKCEAEICPNSEQTQNFLKIYRCLDPKRTIQDHNRTKSIYI